MEGHPEVALPHGSVDAPALALQQQVLKALGAQAAVVEAEDGPQAAGVQEPLQAPGLLGPGRKPQQTLQELPLEAGHLAGDGLHARLVHGGEGFQGADTGEEIGGPGFQAAAILQPGALMVRGRPAEIGPVFHREPGAHGGE